MTGQRKFPIPYDYFKSIVTLFLILLILLAWHGSGPPPTLSVAVDPDGSVTYSGSAKPGRQLSINVVDAHGKSSKIKVLADDAGNWLASKRLPPGSYTAFAAASGRRSPPVTFKVPASAALGEISIRSKENLVAGKAAPNQPLLVIVDGSVVGKITTAKDGTWSFSVNAEPGDHIVQVAYATAPTIVSPQVTVEIKPAPATHSAQIERAFYKNGRVFIQGKAPAGARHVFVWVDGALLGSCTPAADGSWQISASLPPGKHQVWASLDEEGKSVGKRSVLEVPKNSHSNTPRGREYIVKEGDWLSKLAQKYLGSTSRYAEIRRATNAKAVQDPSFATIEDDNLIFPGEKIWIPAR